MKSIYTKEQRLEAYTAALDRLVRYYGLENYSFSLCALLPGYPSSMIRNDFPEFAQQRPLWAYMFPDKYWWNLNKKGCEKRMRVLQKCKQQCL